MQPLIALVFRVAACWQRSPGLNGDAGPPDLKGTQDLPDRQVSWARPSWTNSVGFSATDVANRISHMLKQAHCGATRRNNGSSTRQQLAGINLRTGETSPGSKLNNFPLPARL